MHMYTTMGIAALLEIILNWEQPIYLPTGERTVFTWWYLHSVEY